MTFQEPNSGAVPQPGGYAYKPADGDDAKSAIEDTEENAKLAIAGEAPFDNFKAGTTTPEDIDEAAAEGEDSDDEDKAPAKSASKGEWVDYAVAQGADKEEAESSTKDELIEQYGS